MADDQVLKLFAAKLTTNICLEVLLRLHTLGSN